jgi:hypothetical protein
VAPIRLTFHHARYDGRDYPSGLKAGIRHRPSFENVSGRTIVAIRLGFVSFDFFDEYIGMMHGYSTTVLDPKDSNAKKSEVWVHTGLGDFSFHTSVAFVDKVRFKNGEVWSADLDAVLAVLEIIEPGFRKSRIEKVEGHGTGYGFPE